MCKTLQRGVYRKKTGQQITRMKHVSQSYKGSARRTATTATAILFPVPLCQQARHLPKKAGSRSIMCLHVYRRRSLKVRQGEVHMSMYLVYIRRPRSPSAPRRVEG